MISSFELNLRQSTCLLGESGSGKSLLLKKLVSDSSLYNTNGTVRFYFGESKKVENWKNTFHYSQLSFPYQKFLDSFLTDSFAMGNKLAIALKLLDHPDYFFCEQLHLSDHDFSLFLHFLRRKSAFLFFFASCFLWPKMYTIKTIEKIQAPARRRLRLSNTFLHTWGNFITSASASPFGKNRRADCTIL